MEYLGFYYGCKYYFKSEVDLRFSLELFSLMIPQDVFENSLLSVGTEFTKE